MLSAVNANVNDTPVWESDDNHYDIREHWTIPSDGIGDCEDYALMKRKILIDDGVSTNLLRLATAYLPDGALHTVLIVVTDGGDYILDSVTRDIRDWNETSLPGSNAKALPMFVAGLPPTLYPRMHPCRWLQLTTF